MTSADSDTPAAVDVVTRILEAAQRCFYRSGITATGVDTLAVEAGVSKRTLYNHFGSKDGLVTAYLQRRESRWRQTLARMLDAAGDDPVARLLAYVRGYACPIDDTEFRGCAFINAAAELADDEHPALGVVRSSIDNVQRGMRQVLADAGVADPDPLARQLLVVLEGAVAVGGIRRSDAIFADTERLVEALVRPHLP